MKKYTFILLELILLFSSNFNGTTGESCNNKAVLDASKQLLNLLDYNPTKLLEVSFNLFAYFKSDNDNCDDTDSKLNNMLNKLTVISSNIENLKLDIKCEKTIQLYPALYSRMRSLAQQRFQYFQDKSNNEAKEQIRKVCIHETEGINKMFTSLTYLLEENVVSDLFNYCFHYQSKHLNAWKRDVVQLALLFEFLGRLCEEVHLPADFYYTRFTSQVYERLTYYSDIMIVDKFANNYETGIRYWIEHVIKKSKSANETRRNLKEMFSFFEWTVFYFKKDVYDHKYYSQNVTNLCGSHFCINQDDFPANVFVSWCLPNSFDNSLLNINTFKMESNDALEEIKLSNENLNYALVIRKYDRRFFTLFTKVYQPDICGPLKYRYYFTECLFGCTDDKLTFNYIFTSSLTFKKLSLKILPEFSDTAFFFHRSSFVINERIRLVGHYEQKSTVSARKCRLECQIEHDCKASSFNYDSSESNCFFYRPGYTFTKEVNWVSHTDMPLDLTRIINKQNEEKVYVISNHEYELNYEGCFIDYGYGDMPVNIYSEPALKIENCIKYCKDIGYLYAGIKKSEHCFCGNSNHISLLLKLGINQCQQKCSENSEKICFSVYKTISKKIFPIEYDQYKPNEGKWSPMIFCGESDYVNGAKIHKSSNLVWGITLYCLKNELNTKNFNLRGVWTQKAYCNNRKRVTGFKFQVFKQTFREPTLQTSIKFFCEDGSHDGWTDWVLCPKGTAVAGLQTKVDSVKLIGIKLLCL